jgi:tRNA (cytidine/uridine-2'-O-)-methyltransferase
MCQNPKGIPAGRLRARALVRPFHVVLVEPEIPPNTGNVARLCAATACALHLVEPLGFRTDAHAVRRAGLDYWHLVEVYQHGDLETADQSVHQLRRAEDSNESWFFSGRARRSYLDTPFRHGDALVFGKESVGLPESLLEAHEDHVIAIPTLGPVRSLNLANAVAIVVYEALRRSGALVVDESRR